MGRRAAATDYKTAKRRRRLSDVGAQVYYKYDWLHSHDPRANACL